MRTGKWRDRGIAFGVVLSWHMMGWWLLRTLHFDEVADDAPALQIVYVDQPTSPASISPAVHALTHARSSDLASGEVQNDKVAQAHVVTRRKGARPLVAPLPDNARPLSAVFLDQARLAADRHDAGFAPRTFDRIPPELPGAGSERFRMRQPVTPQNAIVWVAKHLQLLPRDYTADPCPRNNENIGNLLSGGESAALKQELDFERLHCRP